MSIIEPAVALSTRQEAFCRHYAASGNAADAARQAGYSGALRPPDRMRAAGAALHRRAPAPHPPVMETHRTRRGADRARQAGAGVGRGRRQRVRLHHAPGACASRRRSPGLSRPPAGPAPGSGRCRMRTNSGRSGPARRMRPAPSPARSPTPCGRAMPAPNAPSPATAKAGRRWRRRTVSTKPRMRRPPAGSPRPSRNAPACP